MQAILLTEEELDQKISDAIQKAMQRVAPVKEKTEAKLDTKNAVKYLNLIGYKCSTSLISKLAMNNEIPLTRYGKRNSYSTADLEKWVETRKQKRVDIAGNVSRSANLKIQR